MPPVRVVIASNIDDLPKLPLLSPHSAQQNLTTVHAVQDIRTIVPRLRAQLAIVNLELVKFSELAELCREFPATAFVCVHRLADDAIWMQALAAGAVDCCVTADLSRILENADRYVAIKEAGTSTAA
jgi:hypothetical protein